MVNYRERLTPSIGLHIALLVILPLGFGMLAPINIAAGIVNATVLYAVALIWFVLLAPVVEVRKGTFRAGRAAIDCEYLTDARIISRVDRSAALSDARAWKFIRAWVPGGVVVTLTDPRDSTPYWYVSTRNPEKLVAALRACYDSQS